MNAARNLLYKPSTIVNTQLYGGIYDYSPPLIPSKRVISHKGNDIYEVRWSAEITMTNELKKPTIDDIIHIELICQPIS